MSNVPLKEEDQQVNGISRQQICSEDLRGCRKRGAVQVCFVLCEGFCQAHANQTQVKHPILSFANRGVGQNPIEFIGFLFSA